MKNAAILILLVTISISSFSQLTEAQYLKKSKQQNLTAALLVGGGSATMLVGLLMYPRDYDFIWGSTPEKEGQANAASAVVVIGTVAVLSSIPFYVWGAKNKRIGKGAAKLGFKMEKNPLIRNQAFYLSPVPSLTVKLPL